MGVGLLTPNAFPWLLPGADSRLMVQAAWCLAARVSTGSTASDVLGWALRCLSLAHPLSSASATRHQISTKSKKRSGREERPREGCLGTMRGSSSS